MSDTCPHCNATLPPVRDAFCTMCGSRLDAPSQQLERSEQLNDHPGMTYIAFLIAAVMFIGFAMFLLGMYFVAQGAEWGAAVILIGLCMLAGPMAYIFRPRKAKPPQPTAKSTDHIALPKPAGAHFRAFYCCYSTEQELAGDDAQAVDTAWARDNALELLRGDDDFFGLVDPDDHTLQFMRKGDQAWMEIPSPEKRGSFGKYVPLDSVPDIIESLPARISPDHFSDMAFDKW